MSQFNFYGTEEDCACLLKQVTSFENIELVPGIKYSAPMAYSFRSDSSKLRRCLKQTRLLYLRGAFPDRPMAFQQLDDGTFVVSEDQSGNMLTLLLPGVERENNVLLLRPGSLSCPAKFWSSDCSVVTETFPELRSWYCGLVKQLKMCLIRKEAAGTAWVGAHAAELLLQRRAKILAAGKWWMFQNGVAYKDKRVGR